MRATKMVIAVTAGVLSLGVVRGALAQACVGIPAGSGQYALAGGVGLTSNATNFGAAFQANVRGPLSLGAAYTLTNVDNTSSNGNTLAGTAAYEVPNRRGPVSVCPAAGIGYSWIGASNDLTGASVSSNEWRVPVGLSVGATLPAGRKLAVTPYGAPAFLFRRTRVTVEDGSGGKIESTDSNAEFAATLGGSLSSGSLFGGLSLTFTTIDGSDPVFGLQLGAIF